MDNKAIGLQALYTTFDCAEDQTELHEKCTFIKLLHYVCSIWIFIPLMHNAARFLKCVWPFWDLMYQRVKGFIENVSVYRQYLPDYNEIL